MDAVKWGLVIFTLAISAAGWGMFVYAVAQIVRHVRLGKPAPDRFGPFWPRLKTMLVETVGHTRMLKWSVIGVAHWWVAFGFLLLVPTLAQAYGQLFDPEFVLPIIGHFAPFEFIVELFSWATLIAIVVLIAIRQISHPRRLGRASRFEGSNFPRAYFVEFVIVAIPVLVLLLRGMEGALQGVDSYNLHYALSYPLVLAFSGAPTAALETGILVAAALKIIISMTWMIVLARNLTMGVAWHRFAAFFNIYFKRNADGSPALGPAKQMLNKDGQPLDFEEADPDEDPFGVGKIEDFTWKGLLDFTTCTECGRCQSQCPAWNTGKPLSPKKLVMDLRDHAYAKAPYLMQGITEETPDIHDDVLALLGKPLVGTEEEGGVIHPDVLWSCTNCGACVEQCPVDIEHIDHILDMRRYQVMIESSFPSEASTLLKNLENKGNPWGMSEQKRLDWVEELDFEVPVVEDKLPEGTEYLFWVGCAGALEDRAKKTTKAIAELLHMAGVKFAVLGGMEACSGDPARRLGMEFVFQMLAQQNVETLNEVGATKIVASCPHCFNTLGNEYPQLGGDYDVVHHSQLLARLVEEGRLTPVQPIEENITYHDPCFLGRHNKVYTPPREIMAQVPGIKTVEMHRHKERGFCCGAGGARMWMEERIGKRINTERVDEALTTNPDTVSTACPFCQVMLGDAINEKKSKGEAKETLEVVDVSQLLLRSVKGESPAAGEPVRENA
ncbi:Fe-S oxidoreductase [Marinactinospora thermotolerans DSM 45154]|uniref:Fe-S oxidoreductase n=2 Tax=Marinactinospora thermotolerans TaxID=531310 RepID=A0A1T4N846_9ACTN|nr:Fe-S oxidoreductase [Marinactinospora thermotolerans DSM 45154]